VSKASLAFALCFVMLFSSVHVGVVGAAGPGGLPEYPGGTEFDFASVFPPFGDVDWPSGVEVATYYATTGSSSAILSWYRTEMSGLGWTNLYDDTMQFPWESEIRYTNILAYEKGSDAAVIVVEDDVRSIIVKDDSHTLLMIFHGPNTSLLPSFWGTEPTQTTLSVSPPSFTLYSGQTQTLTATLKDENNNPLANKTVAWTKSVGSLSATSGTTSSSGQVSVTYTAPNVTAQTSVTITASLAGDANYQSSSGTSSGTINPRGTVGVKVGDWANYHTTFYRENIFGPAPEWYILEVADVSENNVTIQGDMYYENGEKEPGICTGDPIAGTGMLGPWLAPGGLGPGDQFTIWLQYENVDPVVYIETPVTIIETISRTYAGESREVNHVRGHGPYSDSDFYYDRETGILCETIIRYNGLVHSMVMTETNMWGPTSEVIPAPQSVTETNPITIDATETTNTIVNVTSLSDSCAVTIENVTEAPSSPSGLEVIGNPIFIDNSKPVTITAVLRISYDLAELSAKVIVESSLTIHYWDGSAWVQVESHVNVEEQYVWAEIDHFSYWALMGETAPPAGEGLTIIGAIAAIVIAAIAAVLIVVKRRRR